MGRFTSTDPIILSQKRIINPQIWNSYSYAANNPFKFIDPSGEELVPLGIHTDEEIKKLKKQLKETLKNVDDKEQKKCIKEQMKTLDLEKEGNGIAQAYLDRLDAVGERNGLTLKDIVLSTDTANDFAPGTFTEIQMDNLTNPETKAFVIDMSGPIYLRSESDLYQNSSNNILLQDIGGTVLRHDDTHRRGFGEGEAYRVQRKVFQKFRIDFSNQRKEEMFNNIDKMLMRAIKTYGQ